MVSGCFSVSTSEDSRTHCSMSHGCGRSSSEKSDLCKGQSKAADSKCCCFNASSGDSKYFKHHKDKQHKIRRLKTRKERCQMKVEKGTSENKAHLHHCFCQSRKDLAFFPNFCHSCHGPSRKKTPISSAPLVTQEPSIITDSRLTGHHGLFNHEVKSIDIERFLREKSTLGQSEQKTNEMKDYTSNLSPTASSPVLLSSDGSLGANAEEGVPVKKKMNAATNTDSQEIEMINFPSSNQGTDRTLGVQQQLHSSSESLKSLNQTKNSFQASKTKSTDKCLSGMNEAFHMKPFDTQDKIKTLSRTTNEEIVCDQKQSNKNQGSQAGVDDQILSPVGQVTFLSDKDPDLILKTTHALAARLCESLHLPVSIRRNLLSESKEVLLKSLQERHGACLQENLKELQRSLGFLIEPLKAMLEQEKDMVGEDELLSTDTSLKTTGSEHFCRKSSSQSRRSLQQVAEDFANPVDSFVNILNETFRPDFSPHLFMDFEPSGTSVSELFTHHQILSQGENASRPECWQETRSKTQELNLLDSFRSKVLNQSLKSRGRIGEQQQHHSKVQPDFQYQDGHFADIQLFSQEQNQSETDRFYFAPIFPSKSPSRPHSNLLQTFGQLSPFHPNYRSNPADMMRYPPSHMLERTLTPPSSSLPSPEHWSFPPMRLY